MPPSRVHLAPSTRPALSTMAVSKKSTTSTKAAPKKTTAKVEHPSYLEMVKGEPSCTSPSCLPRYLPLWDESFEGGCTIWTDLVSITTSLHMDVDETLMEHSVESGPRS
jgi:hypothetical protein